jgi:hypothetical protein
MRGMRGAPLILTVINLVLLTLLLVRAPQAAPATELPVLRGRGLEIVDDRGKVRASITVFPTDPKFRTADGKPLPETVLLRLIDQHGRPNVKIGASENGSGLGLGGATDPTYIQIIAERDETFLKMTNKDGKKRGLHPGEKDGPPPILPAESSDRPGSDRR